MQFDRSDSNRTRAMRVAQLRKGPGVFVYDGSSRAIDAEPTILMSDGASQELFDAAGRPVLDASGRQIYQRRGTPVRDESGNVMLGGPPVLTERVLDPLVVWGVSFPSDKPVRVSDPGLALKLRGMACFEEVEGDVAAKSAPPSMTRNELLRIAKERGLSVDRGMTKDQLSALVGDA